jgi:hypothetical protein
MADYRKIYKKHYGEIPNNWIVHHIDGNRSNNDKENLIAVPQSVHDVIHLPAKRKIELTLKEALLGESEWQPAKDILPIRDRIQAMIEQYEYEEEAWVGRERERRGYTYTKHKNKNKVITTWRTSSSPEGIESRRKPKASPFQYIDGPTHSKLPFDKKPKVDAKDSNLLSETPEQSEFNF